MVDILGLADVPVPSFGIGTGYISIIVAAFFFAVAFAIVIYTLYMRKIYNKRIIVFENVAGQGYQLIFTDRARTIKLGSGGEELLFLKKKKVYRTAYGRKMGKNTYWFAIGQDGFWYNIILGDVDAKLGMLDIEPIDRDLRYMHVAIRKNIQDSYKSKKINTATAIVVGGIVLTVLIIVIGNWFMLDKIAEIAQVTTENVRASIAVQESTNKILTNLDRVTSTSGVIPGG